MSREGCDRPGECMDIDELQWYVLYVKSRHEFSTCDELLKKGVEAYVPAVRRLRQWKDRRKFVDFPLFPGYVFVRISGTPEAFLGVLKTRGVVRFVSLRPGVPTPVPAGEVNSLKLLIKSGEDFDIHPEIKEGSRVRVRRGPLRGAEGVLKSKENQHTFFVNIELLGRSVGVRVYADDLEAA